MSDQDNMDEAVVNQQLSCLAADNDDKDSMCNDDGDQVMVVSEVASGEEPPLTHDSENAQAPTNHGVEDVQDHSVQDMDVQDAAPPTPIDASNPAAQYWDGDEDEDEDEDEDSAVQHFQQAQNDEEGRENQNTNNEVDEDMDEDQVVSQEDVVETLEKELGLAPGSFGPPTVDPGMAGMNDEHQEHDDVVMNDDRLGHDSVEPNNVTEAYEQKQQEQESRATPAHAPQDGTDKPYDNMQAEAGPQQQGASNSRAAYVEGEQFDNDPASLFVPEAPPPASRAPPRQGPPMNMPPPSRPTEPASKSGMSMFERIRNMQKATADKKNAIKKQSITSQWVPEPDNETYLEAVMSSITPSASTPAPQVHEDEMVDRRALAEFQREQRRYNELKRKNGGKLTFRQDVEWLKIKGAETARKKKHARDLAKAMADAEGDTELFPEAHTSRDADKGDGGNESDDAFNFDSSGPSRKRQRRDMPRKEPKQLSMQEAELQSMQVALEATDDLPKKNRKSQPTDDDSQDTRANAKGKGSKARVKATKAKTASKPAAKGPRKTMKARRETDRAVKMTTSLFNADVFEQQAGNDAREQPTFRSRNKQDALKELIASVPLDERKQVRSDMGVLLAATKDFDGYGSVKAAGGNWLVKGMSTSLKGYQVMGSAFMRRRENAMEQPRGGLMADQMGLGKTLMMLANIVNGQPPRGQQPRTTLLVASPALLTQWGKEIDQHTKCGLGVMRYGSGNRLDSNHAFDILKGHDIILTTYGEVMKSYPKNEPPIECQTAEQKIAWWKNQFETQRGVLHRMRFLRIVLDEAQAIKNHMGRTSISCRALMADHKWALSGTPILNSLTELYPYFKFLGVPHTGSFKIFKHNYCDTNDVENTERLLVRLSQFMIRRTHADMMFNAPILKLPQADQATYWCEFNPVERCIYDIVHQRFAKNINLWQAKDELEKCYSNALVMLLRLRQLTAHILMLQFVMRDLLEVEDIARIKEVVNEASADSTTRSGRTIVALRRQLEKHAIEEKKRAAAVAKAKAEAQAAGRAYVEVQDEDVIEEVESQERDEPSGQPTAQEGASLGGSGEEFGKTFNFKPYLKSLKTGEGWDKAKKRAKCSYCGKPPKNPWITSCGHLICEVPCMEQSDLAAAEVEKVHSPCKACGQTPVSVQPCEFEEEPPETMAGATRSKAAKKPAKQRERRDREDISADWLSLAGAEVLPSAKTLAIKAQILNWTREDPKVKIIIYTQFLAMVRILGKICQHEGWQAEQYIGTMSFAARDKAISTFAGNDKCNILLASLRCGGLGLNLTMASRVIMVDPWWNSASEQQAFCRVFRIGQKEETYMSRLCVKGTVDSRLIAMQERKQKEIGEVMEDGGKRVQKMSIPDLMRLFGNLDEDAEGKPYIMVDNPDPRGGFRADADDEDYADDG